MKNELFNPLKIISWHVLSGNRQALYFLDKVNIPWRLRKAEKGCCDGARETRVFNFPAFKIFMVAYFNSYYIIIWWSKFKIKIDDRINNQIVDTLIDLTLSPQLDQDLFLDCHEKIGVRMNFQNHIFKHLILHSRHL